MADLTEAEATPGRWRRRKTHPLHKNKAFWLPTSPKLRLLLPLPQLRMFPHGSVIRPQRNPHQLHNRP